LFREFNFQSGYYQPDNTLTLHETRSNVNIFLHKGFIASNIFTQQNNAYMKNIPEP